jgi:hypothetical protein
LKKFGNEKPIIFKEESNMITWNNLDTLASFKELEGVKKVNLAEVMAGKRCRACKELQRSDGRGICL